MQLTRMSVITIVTTLWDLTLAAVMMAISLMKMDFTATVLFSSLHSIECGSPVGM